MAATGKRIQPMVWVLAAAAGGAVFCYFVNPAYCPPCPLHAWTGLNCPGCGATRAAHELIHGHLRTALHLNALFVLGVPVLLAVGLWQVAAPTQGTRLHTLVTHRGWGWLILLLVLTFGIVRNIPSYPFTLLSP